MERSALEDLSLGIVAVGVILPRAGRKGQGSGG
jgi:hypothetical protein